MRTNLITSDLVLGEFLNYFSKKGDISRIKAVEIVGSLQNSSDTEIIYSSKGIFNSAKELYRNRPDKLYSYVDCSSMIIMKQYGIKNILTTDHHFEQEGFIRLLK